MKGNVHWKCQSIIKLHRTHIIMLFSSNWNKYMDKVQRLNLEGRVFVCRWTGGQQLKLIYHVTLYCFPVFLRCCTDFWYSVAKRTIISYTDEVNTQTRVVHVNMKEKTHFGKQFFYSKIKMFQYTSSKVTFENTLLFWCFYMTFFHCLG